MTDNTLLSQNVSEDSGCVTTSEISSTCDGISSINRYTNTPIITSSSIRKRKLSQYNRSQPKNILESFHNESPVTFDYHANLLSSTLNESLSKSLERCNLAGLTPNLHSNHSSNDYDIELSNKRCKRDNDLKCQPKSRSAPSTPTKHLEDDEKACSEHLNFTKYYKADKLGTSERLALLYPNIHQTASPVRIKTPEKLREFSRKINSPAKKRLFETSQAEKSTNNKTTCDPINLFIYKNDFRHIISKIFEYLSPSDLCSVSKVNRAWKKALKSDHKAFPRYYVYSLEYTSNKENVVTEEGAFKKWNSPPTSPERDNFHRCTKIVSRLSPSQNLQKCIRCMELAVIQKSISQCQNPNCEYIYCKNCLSFSTTGPENFIDKCNTSELLIANKNNSFTRHGLYDISNESSVSPSFFFNDSSSVPFQLSQDSSSGYLSEKDISPIVKRNLSFNMDIKPLQTASLNKVQNTSHRRKRRPSLVSVVSIRKTSTILEKVEPSSPPRIKNIACSLESKKNLKRLHF